MPTSRTSPQALWVQRDIGTSAGITNTYFTSLVSAALKHLSFTSGHTCRQLHCQLTKQKTLSWSSGKNKQFSTVMSTKSPAVSWECRDQSVQVCATVSNQMSRNNRAAVCWCWRLHMKQKRDPCLLSSPLLSKAIGLQGPALQGQELLFQPN